jgi:PAS domain S-box-containing protein
MRAAANRTSDRLAIGAGVLAAALGLIVLAGWYTHIVALVQLHPQFVAMQPNAALCFLLGGVGLLGAVAGRPALSIACGGSAAASGALTLAQYTIGVDLGIDTLILAPWTTVGASSPGRMGPNTALSFVLSGAALVVACAPLPLQWRSFLVGIPSTVVVALATVALFGYASGMTAAYSWGGFTYMALHTAFGFVVLGGGLLARAWRDSMDTTYAPRWLPALAAAGGLTITLGLYQSLAESELATRTRSPLPGMALSAGLLLTVLLTGSVALAQTARRRARQIELINHELERQIGERRQAEDALHASQARLAGILDIADDAIISMNDRQEIVLFNQGAERVFGYNPADVIGQSLDILLPTRFADIHRHHVDAFARSADVARKMGGRRELSGRRADGTEFPSEASISKLILNNEVIFTVMLRDITARRQAETRLHASLREKEILLQEVHHRVKNNLQVIKSLLRLQAYTVMDPALRELFHDSQNRVQAMALVHEQLYRAHDLDHIDFATYLRELAASVLRSYEGRSAQITLTFDIDSAVALNIDTAIPLGLILTELVSNSIKHAFRDGRTGTIAVGLRSDAEGLALSVRDDGVGIPETLDPWATGSLGLQLVGDLTQQLGGALAIERREGACFQVHIPHPSSQE